MKKVELLSPAGNFESLKAAINNGADAVYLGGNLFSARAFADNFNDEEMIEAIRYAHLRNVKVYVTLNTLLNEFEIDNAYNKAKFYYEHNVDALIIQDLGLFYRLRLDFPDFELHASTQMHIHNLQGVRNASELGFKRVVVARESSLKQINEFCKEDIEIECFVHGAICVSYSGQCLMSSATKNRSANKGMCAQCCRLKYSLYANDKKVNTDTEYLLSPKDMCLLEDIPSLIEAGVTSFKIEGRMKSPAYVGYVTRLYRQAIDAYYNNQNYKVDNTKITNLKLLYNRGFTNTYLRKSNDDLFSNIRPNHMGIEIGKVIKVNDNSVLIKLTNEVNQFDGIRILSKQDTGLILNMFKVNRLLVSKAYRNEVIEVSLKDKVFVNDKVVKTQDYILENDIVKTFDKLVPVALNITIKENLPIVIEALSYKYTSNYIPQKALNRPITIENIEDCFKKSDKHPYYLSRITVDLNDCFIPIKELNEIRREFYDRLDNHVLNSFKRGNYQQLALKELNINNDSEILTTEYLNPVVNIDSKYNNDCNLVSEFGGIYLSGIKDGFYTMNIANSYAYELLLRLGFRNIVLSSELDPNMINELVLKFKERTGLMIKPYVICKGNRTLMYISRNPFDKYTNSTENVKLSDGNNVYKVKFNDSYIELIDTNTVEIDQNSLISYRKYTI